MGGVAGGAGGADKSEPGDAAPLKVEVTKRVEVTMVETAQAVVAVPTMA